MATDLGVAPEEMRVLVLAPRGRDAALTRELLDAERMRCHVCSSIEELCSNLRNGAGTAIVAHEALDDRARLALRSVLAAQPAWSDLQVIVFTDERRRGEALPGLELIGNVMPIDRPVPVRAMISSVRSALRARLRQYEVRRALRARDQFLAMLGHELRNPLGAIRLAAEVLDGSGVCGQNNRQLAVIERQSMHLTRLVDDLLDVSRVTSGKVSLKKVRVDLNELLRNCLQTAEPQLKSHQLTLRTELETRPLPVFGDRVRLEQVFGNLISNAIKYTPPGGHVHVSSQLGDTVGQVRIMDTGVGIDPAMLDRVFELFAQADRSLDRSEGGLGVGLSLVKSLVELHGGRVRASSAGIGKGCELRVHLPLMAADEDGLSYARSASPA